MTEANVAPGLLLEDAAALSGNTDVVFDYERSLARYFGATWAISMSNGTAALHAALLALGVPPGGRVVVPVTAPVMSVVPILAVGAEPVFVDVAGPCSFGISASDLGSIGKVDGVIAVPMWGYWDESTELLADLRGRGVPLVIDAAQAHHVRFAEGSFASRADVVCYSTHARKPLSTGEGGFCVCNDERVACELRSVRNFGQRAFRVHDRIVADGPFGVQFGLNLKLSGIQALVGLRSLTTMDEDRARRVRVASALRNRFADFGTDVREFSTSTDSEPGLYGLALSLPGRDGRRIGRAVAERVPCEVETVKYAFDLASTVPAFAAYARATPNAAVVVDEILALRLAGFDEVWADDVAKALCEALGGG